MKTYAVVNVIMAKQRVVEIYIMLFFLVGICNFSFSSIRIIKYENIAPRKLDIIKELAIELNIITFLINTASIAVKISA